MIRLAIVAVFVVGGIGAVIFRDRLSSGAGTLTIGECFDDPVGAQLITDVQHHPCSEAHTAEVIYLGKLPDGSGSFPTTAAVQDWIRSTCVPAWNTYTGKDFDTDATLTLGFYQPSPEAWSGGDRSVVCYAARVDSAPMTSSVKKAP
jgi:hypothetical protein